MRKTADDRVNTCMKKIENRNRPKSYIVVQGIVSLTTSLRLQLVKYLRTTLSNTLFFLLEICENFASKIYQCICNIGV